MRIRSDREQKENDTQSKLTLKILHESVVVGRMISVFEIHQARLPSATPGRSQGVVVRQPAERSAGVQGVLGVLSRQSR